MLGGGAFYRGNRDLFIVITKVRLTSLFSSAVELERVMGRKKFRIFDKINYQIIIAQTCLSRSRYINCKKCALHKLYRILYILINRFLYHSMEVRIHINEQKFDTDESKA